jgi:hypothetical protein
MAYLVFCTFDLKNATSTDYQNAYADLKALGLEKVQKGGSGNNVVIPTTSAMGEYNGADAGSVRDTVRDNIRAAFAKRGFKSEIFVVVGGSWAWGSGTT